MITFVDEESLRIDNVTIGQGSLIYGRSFISDYVEIGDGCIIFNSTIGNDSIIQSGVKIVNSVLGACCNIYSGCIILDSLLNHSTIVNCNSVIKHSVIFQEQINSFSYIENSRLKLNEAVNPSFSVEIDNILRSDNDFKSHLNIDALYDI